MKSWKVLVPTAVVVAGVTGISVASIPDGAGVVHACYGPTGAVRFVDSPSKKCNFTETAVNLNQTGPPGAPGAPGPSDAWWSGQINLKMAANGTTEKDLTSALPAGSYLVQGQFELNEYPIIRNPSDHVTCTITDADAQGIYLYDTSGLTPAFAALTISSAEPLHVSCSSSFASGETSVQIYASAIKVGTLHD